MSVAKAPEEARRIAALHALNILDTDREDRFDRITRLAQRIFDAPISTVTLVDSDRVWFKSAQGMDGDEDPREVSFCAHAILEPQTTMVVEDATLDERFVDNPRVTGDPNVRFYAGHPVEAPGGEQLGTICVVDDKPRLREEFDAEALRELAAMVEAEIVALSLAIGDELTGLANRRGFEMLGERLVASAARLDLGVSAIYADLDNMKPINDRFGHEAGDRALVDVAGVLASALRASDLIARLGGDEFCALLVGRAAAAAAPALAARVEAALASHNAAGEDPYELSLSIGLAESPAAEQTELWELVGRADQAMLESKRAKKAGGDPVAR